MINEDQKSSTKHSGLANAEPLLAGKKSLKGTWFQALTTFFSPLLLFLIIRWAFVEPFVIPSESMVPNLLVHDHILVFKSAFGLKVPFSDSWIINWSGPKIGDVVVFKYPINPNIYYIKRVIGGPGDTIKIVNGRPTINNKEPLYTPYNQDKVYIEELLGRKHKVRFVDYHSEVEEEQSVTVPEGQYFVMGDNRDSSSDSRVWGFVPEKYLVGRAWFIWLSCEETMSDFEFLCDPMKMRWSRFFNNVESDL